MELTPRESALFISEHSDHVKINRSAIPAVAQKLFDNLKSGVFGSSWDDHPMHPKAVGPSTVNWIFLIDSLNFSFWTDENIPKYVVTFRGTPHTGYMALCAAINRALEEGKNLLDANVLASLTLDDARSIFRSDDPNVEIPLLETRLQIMREHASTLLSDYSGCFTKCIEACHGSAAKLLKLVCEKFPSFSDKAVYKGRNVTFYKRGQILIADLWLAFKGESYGHFDDIDSLTAFADYRVPQVLAYFGVLHYDDELMQKLLKKEHLESGSVWEVEIRGACLEAVELIVQKTRELFAEAGDERTRCNSILADNFLWLYRRQFASEVEECMPMHRTRCIYY
uniref:Queuosine 5'-phosphate N-glycosylase/hydrolase n=1 Tax=Mesocestoides corti TaxID=53468 RepID=A0A5K3FM03_MESCO